MSEWYPALVDEVDYTISHYQSMAMETVRDCWWSVGDAIARMREHAEQEGMDQEGLVQRLHSDIKKRNPDRKMSRRTLFYACKFRNSYPDKGLIPNKSWKKIIEEDLTEPKQIPDNHDCEWETIQICTTCKKRKGE